MPLRTALTAALERTPRVVFLLYLNNTTYAGEEGQQLASQLRELLSAEAPSRWNGSVEVNSMHAGGAIARHRTPAARSQ